MRLPIELRSWPLQTPYVVSLTGDRYVTLVLLGDGGRNLFFADQANALSLGDDQRFDTPVAMGSQGRPLMELMDVNQDGASDLVARFAVAELLGNGDIALGARSMHLTAAANFGFFVKGDLRVTFVQ